MVQIMESNPFKRAAVRPREAERPSRSVDLPEPDYRYRLLVERDLRWLADMAQKREDMRRRYLAAIRRPKKPLRRKYLCSP